MVLRPKGADVPVDSCGRIHVILAKHRVSNQPLLPPVVGYKPLSKRCLQIQGHEISNERLAVCLHGISKSGKLCQKSSCPNFPHREPCLWQQIAQWLADCRLGEWARSVGVEKRHHLLDTVNPE